MRIKAPNNYCDGCVWGKVDRQLKLVFCPFSRCQRRNLTIERNNVAKKKHVSRR